MYAVYNVIDWVPAFAEAGIMTIVFAAVVILHGRKNDLKGV